MTEHDPRDQPQARMAHSPASAEWYDRSVNWAVRFDREIPLIGEVLGPPGRGGIIDAGCGTGRHVLALAAFGYSVVGADVSEEMLSVGRQVVANAGTTAGLEQCTFAEMPERLGSGFGGVVCLGNALAAAGSAAECRRAIDSFAAVLRPGGRLFLQILNFPPMRQETPCVRGPRVVQVDGVEYVSVRVFSFHPQDESAGPQGRCDVTNVTLWKDQAWQTHKHCGSLYPVPLEELRSWCDAAGLKIIEAWGSYKREPVGAPGTTDVILAAERLRDAASPTPV